MLQKGFSPRRPFRSSEDSAVSFWILVFSPFFQGKGSEISVVKGSGLGLAISKEYVQNHDGTIRLLNGKKGARFLVTLPLSG